MDRRIFDMLNMYREANCENQTAQTKDCINNDFCLETNYTNDNNGILAMAFVNMQPLDSVYETEDGFKRGTLYPNLDKPFHRGGAR